MKVAIYPGSFDPISKGHLNIIERASKIFDKLIVCVMVNGAKRPIFSSDERVELIRRVTRHLSNVEVHASGELLADFARRMGSSVIIKGLRAATDFENEFQMAIINRTLNPGLDTMFLTSEHQYMFMSSSAIRELSRYDVDLSEFLPEEIIPDVKEKTHLILRGGK